MADRQPLADPKAVAEFLGLTVQQLAHHRYAGTGPRFTKVTGRQVRYRWADVEAWLEANTRARTGAA